ncbi:hypothetical protein PIB30_044513 [Stylosanthes scabra]|uniref:Armadillo repeat-containing protein 7 n=1 Tax=Stylosanthes scabra TaxID=79078 RepID=A0ABU6QGD7_9FABA|nr:hypothetical protein [Stylosanthes scabra]
MGRTCRLNRSDCEPATGAVRFCHSRPRPTLAVSSPFEEPWPVSPSPFSVVTVLVFTVANIASNHHHSLFLTLVSHPIQTPSSPSLPPRCRRTFSYMVGGASVLVGRFNEELVTQFQNTPDEVTRERILANLANFAYDPYNYNFLRQLNVLELFLDCMTEPNEKLVEFGVGGICNSCADPANVALVSKFGGIPLIIQCLSSPVRNTVNYALGALYYICNESNKEEILKPEVVDAIKRYAAAEEVSASFSNLAKAFLEKHPSEN